MTVKELIEKLQQLNQEHRVVVSGYEGGYADVGDLEEIFLKLNVNTAWYYGPHEQSDDKSNPAILLT